MDSIKDALSFTIIGRILLFEAELWIYSCLKQQRELLVIYGIQKNIDWNAPSAAQ